MWIDLKTENGFRVRNGQGLRICNYFYRMAYSFFTITSTDLEYGMVKDYGYVIIFIGWLIVSSQLRVLNLV